jgi:NADPH:quinone reductase-like Zn-dependent oxidoreductase
MERRHALDGRVDGVRGGCGSSDAQEGRADVLDAGRIRAVIDSTVAFEDAQAGLARVASGRARGKVVIEVG